MATAWQIWPEQKEKAYSTARASICMLCGIFPQGQCMFLQSWPSSFALQLLFLLLDDGLHVMGRHSMLK